MAATDGVLRALVTLAALAVLSNMLNVTGAAIRSAPCLVKESDYVVKMTHDFFNLKRRIFFTVISDNQVATLSDLQISHTKRAHVITFSRVLSENGLYFTHSHPEEFKSLQQLSGATPNYTLAYEIAENLSGSNTGHDIQIGFVIENQSCPNPIEVERSFRISLQKDGFEAFAPSSTPGKSIVSPVAMTKGNSIINGVLLDGLTERNGPTQYIASAPLLSSRFEFTVGRCTTVLVHVSELEIASGKVTPLTSLAKLLMMAAHVAAYNSMTGEIVHSHGMSISDDLVPDSYRNSVAVYSREASQLEVITGAANMCRHDHRLKIRYPHEQMHMTGDGKFGPWIAIPLMLPSPGYWRLVIQMRNAESLIVSSLFATAK